MTWNIWDVLIVLLFAAQVGAVAAIAIRLLKLRRTAVAPIGARGQGILVQGKALAATAKAEYLENRVRVTALLQQTSALRTSLRFAPITSAMAGEVVSIASIVAARNNLRKLRSGWGMLKALKQQGFKAAITGKKKTAAKKAEETAWFERLGLMPPIVRRLRPALHIGRTALGVHRQLRRNGLL